MLAAVSMHFCLSQYTHREEGVADCRRRTLQTHHSQSCMQGTCLEQQGHAEAAAAAYASSIEQLRQSPESTTEVGNSTLQKPSYDR